MKNNVLRASLLAVVCAALMADVSFARSAYDGNWSVVFYTRSGACDAAYRSGVVIQNGGIYPEAGGFNFNGRVSPKGEVRASISAGAQNASGSGRLGPRSGSGVWRGEGSVGFCAGTWAAERHG